MSNVQAVQAPPTTAEGQPTSDRRPKRVGKVVSTVGGRYGLLVVLVAVVAGFSILRPDTYPTVANAQTIVANNVVIAFLALAAMMPLITGQFDVSLGYQLGLSQALTAGLILRAGLPWPLAVVTAVVACMVVGIVNGLLVTRLGLTSFIATLGSGTVVYGLTQLYSRDETIIGDLPVAFTNAGRSLLLGIPLPLVYVVIAVAVLWFAVEFTSWGRACTATGSNARAAELAGVQTKRLTIQTFALAGLLAGMAGVLSVTLLGASSPTVGLGELLPAFAGAFLGATAFRPGRFNAIGTAVAVYMLAAGIAGLQQMGARPYVQQLFNGGALLIALAIAAIAARRSATRSA
jgi:ribose transport system permease protein